MRIGQTALAFLVAISALVAAGSARADAVAIPVTGTIPGGCTVSKTSDFAAANLTASGSVTAGALVDCNLPFLIRSTSANGAIRTAATASAGFANSIAYTYALSVGVQGNACPATVACTSAQMLANNCILSSGNKTANNKAGTLTVNWTPPRAVGCRHLFRHHHPFDCGRTMMATRSHATALASRVKKASCSGQRAGFRFEVINASEVINP